METSFIETATHELTEINAVGDGPDLVGYELEANSVEGGEYVSLILAMRLDEKTADFFAPSLTLSGPKRELNLPFTTDSHLITPLWEPNEVIVERYDFAIPHDLPAGEYSANLKIINLSQNRDSGLNADLGSLKVYFLSNSKRRSVAGEGFGSGCGKYMDVTKFFKKVLNRTSLKLNATEARYISVIAGTFYFILIKDDVLHMGSTSFEDTRYPDLHCMT